MWLHKRGDTTIIGQHNITQVAFKNCAPFIKCIIKVDWTTIDDAEDLDLVMPIIICKNTAWIILTQEVVYGFILKIKQLILMPILQMMMLLNLSNIRLNYKETQLQTDQTQQETQQLLCH